MKYFSIKQRNVAVSSKKSLKMQYENWLIRNFWKVFILGGLVTVGSWLVWLSVSLLGTWQHVQIPIALTCGWYGGIIGLLVLEFIWNCRE